MRRGPSTATPPGLRRRDYEATTISCAVVVAACVPRARAAQTARGASAKPMTCASRWSRTTGVTRGDDAPRRRPSRRRAADHVDLRSLTLAHGDETIARFQPCDCFAL